MLTKFSVKNQSMRHHKRREAMNKQRKKVFNFEQLAEALRKEIEEYGALLILIYEQQNCLAEHNPISLLKATSKIEAQLPANQLATADRTAFMQQLAELHGCEEIQLNELQNFVPEEVKSLFKALVDEIIALRSRIKSKTQVQQKLLGQAQMINSSVLQQVFPGKYNHQSMLSKIREVL